MTGRRSVAKSARFRANHCRLVSGIAAKHRMLTTAIRQRDRVVIVRRARGGVA